MLMETGLAELDGILEERIEALKLDRDRASAALERCEAGCSTADRDQSCPHDATLDEVIAIARSTMLPVSALHRSRHAERDAIALGSAVRPTLNQWLPSANSSAMCQSQSLRFPWKSATSSQVRSQIVRSVVKCAG